MTEVTSTQMTIEEGFRLNRNERLQFLLKQWGMTAPLIYGRLAPRSYYSFLYDVYNLRFEQLEYPLSNFKGLKTVDNVFVRSSRPELEGVMVRVAFSISYDDQCEKYGNPFLLQADPNRFVILADIAREDITRNDKGDIWIDETIKADYLRRNKQALDIELEEEAKQRRNDLDVKLRSDYEAHIEELVTKYQAHEADINGKLEPLRTVHSSLDEQVKDLQKQITDLEKQIKDLVAKREAVTQEMAQQQDASVKQTERLKQDIESLNQRVTELTAEKDKMATNVERLKDLVQQQADRLKSWDFITEKQYREVLGLEAETKAPLDVTEGGEYFWELNGELKGEFSGLLQCIQAYLYNKKKIFYPLHLLTDYLTLLRTHDFIVLAGLSGSGKTQLVKAFAEATGGKAHIIPVKPNWTGAEDLLGYYNPLQRAYLTTPFLDVLIEASHDVSRMHYICLDEMNLARVEYYFADFLSEMEERTNAPTIKLYSSDEADHVHSEFAGFLGLMDKVLAHRPETKEVSFWELLSQENVNRELQALLGTGDKEHLIGVHNRLRRLISGVLNVPSVLELPANVRIIGTVNFDETTHYLAPKVLDRAHVLKFVSPLEYALDKIKNEIDKSIYEGIVPLSPSDLRAERQPYPQYDESDFTAKTLTEWRQEFLAPLGIDIGYRTIRQAMLYSRLFVEAVPEEHQKLAEKWALNNIVLHKLLPRFSFEGRHKLDVPPKNKEYITAEGTKENHVTLFLGAVRKKVGTVQLPTYSAPCLTAVSEIENLLKRAANNDSVFNYWGVSVNLFL